MEEHVSTFEDPAATTPENLTYANTTATQYAMWPANPYNYSMQDPMEWLSNYGGQNLVSNQEYFAALQHSISNPEMSMTQEQYSTPRYQPPAELLSTPGHQGFQDLLPFDNNIMARPQSADMTADNGSSPASRQSSSSNSPLNRARKVDIPTIKTQFENKGRSMTLNETPLNDGVQVAPDSDSMTTMSNEWMHMHGTGDQTNLHEQSLNLMNMKTSPALLEPFQLQSPIARRESMSSAASGSIFSAYGTPLSAPWQHSGYNSPYPQSPYTWTPVSAQNRMNGSPVSPYQARGSRTWNRQQYFNQLRQGHQLKEVSRSFPSRNRPRFIRNVTDCFPNAQSPSYPQTRTRSAESRSKPRSDSNPRPFSATVQQMSLPEFQPSTVFTSPLPSQTDFQHLYEAQTPTRNVLPSSDARTPMPPPPTTPRVQLTPNLNSLHLHTPFVGSQPFPHLPTQLPSTPSTANLIPTPAHQPPLPIPSEPPRSDFHTGNPSNGVSASPDGHSHNHSSACGPIRQSPHFEGDIYTPRFKRRNAAGKWEGWCGYCQPGRWLDLKNSRYWEDKLRNHGICARTKTFFDGPIRVRWISDRGDIWEGEPGDNGFNLANKEGFEDDGVGRKREGLCGECNGWIGMDGMRSRGKGKCVSWWMHAYKCHEQSKSRTDGTTTFDQS